MARLENQKESKNFVNATNPYISFLNNLLLRLNPMVKARQYQSDLIDQGWEAPQDHPLFGQKPFDVNKFIMQDRLRSIMENQALVDPHVISSNQYGDLIPGEKRLDDMFRKDEEARKKKRK